MRKFDKILLFFVSLLGIIFSICVALIFSPIPYVQRLVIEYQEAYPWINYFLIGYGIIISLCFLILLFTTICFPTRSNFMIIKKEKGELQFSKKTIESTVFHSFADMEGIDFIKIKVNLHKKPEKTKIHVSLTLNNTKELIAMTETIQEKISSTLQTSLDVEVKSITIKVSERNSSSAPEKNNENRDENETDPVETEIRKSLL